MASTSPPPSITFAAAATGRRLHGIATGFQRDYGELEQHHDRRHDRRGIEVRDQVGDRVADAAGDRHEATDEAAQQRRAAPRQLAVVGQGLREAHRDAGTERSGRGRREKRSTTNEWRRRRRRPAPESRPSRPFRPTRPGWITCSTKRLLGVLVLVALGLARQALFPRSGPRCARGRPRPRRGRPRASGPRHPSPARRPGGRSARRRAPSRRPGAAMASTPSARTCQTGFRAMLPFTSARRTSGMWPPKRAEIGVDELSAVVVLLDRHVVEHAGRNSG